MEYDPNRNAKVIIPLAIVAWLGGILVFKEGVPAVFEVVYVAAFAIAVPVAVFYLIGEAGWRALTKRYRASVPFAGTWTLCPTGQMALVSVDHPEFHKVDLRIRLDLFYRRSSAVNVLGSYSVISVSSVVQGSCFIRVYLRLSAAKIDSGYWHAF